MVTQALPAIGRMARRRPAKLAYLLLSLGLSFGFVAVVAAVAHASWFRLPAGVADRDYVSLGRETADGAFHQVSFVDARNIAERVPELGLALPQDAVHAHPLARWSDARGERVRRAGRFLRHPGRASTHRPPAGRCRRAADRHPQLRAVARRLCRQRRRRRRAAAHRGRRIHTYRRRRAARIHRHRVVANRRMAAESALRT